MESLVKSCVPGQLSREKRPKHAFGKMRRAVPALIKAQDSNVHETGIGIERVNKGDQVAVNNRQGSPEAVMSNVMQTLTLGEVIQAVTIL